MSNKKNKTNITVIVDDRVHKITKALAKRNRRSMNSYIIELIEKDFINNPIDIFGE